MTFLQELKRRNVLRVAAAYLVAAWLLMQVAATLFPVFDLGPMAVRIVAIVLAVGFVPALVFAWIFEITPGGLKLEKDVDRSQSIAPHTGKWLDRIIIVVLVLALGYFAIDKFVFSGAREASIAQEARKEGRTEALVGSYGEKSIAVLPFLDMSPGNDQGYFADGISEELLNLLAKVPELRVISRSSAFSYKGKQVKLAQVADELHVENVLEGSVRRSGNRVRITAQLIEARSDTHLWSDTFDRDLDDIFKVQDEIAAAVVQQLKVKLLGAAPRAKESNAQAYALFLEARQLGHLATPEGYAQAATLLHEALAIDPKYAGAWDELAFDYERQGAFGTLPKDEARRLSLDAVDKALAIDADLAQPYTRLAWFAYEDGDLVAAARHTQRALSLEPKNLVVLGTAATVLTALGRNEQAVQIDEYVALHDPVNPGDHVNLGFDYIAIGRYDDAIASYHTALNLTPGRASAQEGLLQAMLLKGDGSAAMAAIQELKSEDSRSEWLPLAFHLLGDKAKSDAALNELILKGDDWAYAIARAAAIRAEADRAFEWLDKITHSPASDPFFRGLQSDPRWLPLLRKNGWAPEQLAAITFEVTLER